MNNDNIRRLPGSMITAQELFEKLAAETTDGETQATIVLRYMSDGSMRVQTSTCKQNQEFIMKCFFDAWVAHACFRIG